MEREGEFHNEWPAGFSVDVFYAREEVLYRGRKAHVVEAKISAVPPGEVPIVFDDSEGKGKDGESEFMTVPADDLERVKKEDF